MIDVYFMTSPNVYKVVIALEEMGFEYRLIPTDITRREMLRPDALAGALNGKLPVIVDHDADGQGPVTLFESGAILQYLAERSGRLLPLTPHGRMQVMQWLFWQVGGLGPFGGQCFHFSAIAPAIAPDVDHSYARSRYTNILAELWDVAEARLRDRDYLADDYSIADIACYPWIDYLPAARGRDAYPAIAAWHERIRQRPAVTQAYRRARDVDMGYARDARDTVILPLDRVRKAVTV